MREPGCPVALREIEGERTAVAVPLVITLPAAASGRVRGVVKRTLISRVTGVG